MCIRFAVGSLIALVAVAPALGGGTPLGTAFTYQGQLKENGAPKDGTTHLRFSLWDAEGNGAPPVGGSQIGASQLLANVAVANGLFTVPLNAGGQFGANAFNGEARWLQVEVCADAGCGTLTILAPRQPLTAAPHALFALNASAASTATMATNATQLNGQPAAFYQNASNVNTGTLTDARLSSNVALLGGVQTFTGAKTFSLAPSFTAAGAPFAVSSTTKVTNLNADLLDGLNSTVFLQSIPVPLTLSGTSATHIIKGENASTIVFARGLHGAATGGTGVTIGVLGESASTSGAGVFGLASAATGTTYGVSGQSDSPSGSGVYGTSVDNAGVYGFASGASGVNYGGRFESNSTSGRGVYGIASATSGITYGVLGESESSGGRGVYGLASSATGTTDGVRGTASSDSGRGVVGWATSLTGTTRGVYGRSDSTDGRGVFGWATAATGFNYGGRFESDSTDGIGVYGLGSNSGVYGETASTDGRGVVGFATAASSRTLGVLGTSFSTGGRGVVGYASAATGNTYGVLGEVNANNSAGYGVFSNGDMGAFGTKPFRIDHPDDPANKYLLHYAAESPEVINFYRGTVVLDGAGEAVVELPHYFAKINKTPSYQLTAVGAPMPMLHVAEEIDEAALSAGATAGPGVAAPICSFRIAGGAPGAKVSWRVEALRNDLWVQKRAVPMEVIANGLSIQTRAMPVEVEKHGLEKGTYQHPELYGLSAERGMDYDAKRERPSPAEAAPR